MTVFVVMQWDEDQDYPFIVGAYERVQDAKDIVKSENRYILRFDGESRELM